MEVKEVLILVANSEICSGSLREVLENRSCQLGRPRENEFATSIGLGHVCVHICRGDLQIHQGGVDPGFLSDMAQNSPNGGPSTSHNALKFGIAIAYDGSKQPF
jgi:hypothetical protein